MPQAVSWMPPLKILKDLSSNQLSLGPNLNAPKQKYDLEIHQLSKCSRIQRSHREWDATMGREPDIWMSCQLPERLWLVQADQLHVHDLQSPPQ